MKRLMLALALAASIVGASAATVDQPHGPSTAAQRAAMAKLSFLKGHWTGEARATRPDGSVVVSRSEDDVDAFIDGTVLTIHGHSYAPGAPADASPVGENLGVLTFNDREGRYELRTFAQGAVQTGSVQSVADGEAHWSLPSAAGDLRFDVRADGPDRWTETIERSSDNGRSWSPMMEIRFRRK